MAWLTSWDHRKSITLSRASGEVTNYQLKLLVGQSSGATGEDVDCGGISLANFNDLRFTNSDGTTVLSHWIESITGTIPNQLATIWIKFDSISTGSTTFYMYYGLRESKAMNAASIRIASDGTIWVGHFSDGTIRKSIDEGDTWTTKYTFVVGTGFVRCVFIAANGYLFASVENGDILIRSTDGGENWSTCKTLSGSGNSVVWHMAQDSGGNIYVGEYSGGNGTETCAYIYKSIDNGANWSTIWNNPDGARHIHFVAVDPYTDRLYASQGDQAKGRLFYSDNQGTDWTTIGSASSLWHPTCVAFGSGFRLFGQDNIDAPPVLIRKTVNDVDFTTSYTPPTADSTIFWNGGERNSDGLIIFSSWTQADNQRPTVIGTKDDGVTWEVLDYGIVSVGNKGYIGVSNADADENFYITRSTEADLAKYSIKASMLPLNISSIIGTMIKGDDGIVGNLTEAVAGTATITHLSGKYKITEDSTDDAAVAGAVLADLYAEINIDEFDEFSGISTGELVYFGIFDASSLANSIGDVTNWLSIVRFAVIRYASNHATLANKISVIYQATDTSIKYWNGTIWTTTTTFASSGSLVVKIWSDNTNFYCDVFSGGASLFTSPAQIAISSVKAISSGNCLLWGDNRNATYAITPTVKNYYIRQFRSPEPAWGAWGNEEFVGSASLSPSVSPSMSFSVSPSVSPSNSPSLSPSASVSPSNSPSVSPSASESVSPSVSPSNSPSLSPSASESPSISPSYSPSISSSESPSPSPSLSPSASPSEAPNILIDGGFELWDDTTHLTHWSKYEDGTAAIHQDGDVKYSGDYSIRMDTTGGTIFIYPTAGVVLTPGVRYRFIIRHKESVNSATLKRRFDFRSQDNNVYLKEDGTWIGEFHTIDLPSSTEWQTFSIDFTAHTDYSGYTFYPFASYEGEVWLDAIYIGEVIPSPSESPSASPSESSSLSPSASVSPSLSPSISLSVSPSESPSVSLSMSPSASPSVSYSKSPSVSPSASPSMSPSKSPSLSPSPSPSIEDSYDYRFDSGFPKDIRENHGDSFPTSQNYRGDFFNVRTLS